MVFKRFWVVAVVMAVAVLGSCTPAVRAPSQDPSGPTLPGAGVRVQAGIEQIYVTGAAPGDRIDVTGPLSDSGAPATSVTADGFGSVAVRGLRQGAAYLVEHPASGTSQQVWVLTEGAHPDASFYAATAMTEGLNYLPMRDGTLLAAVVRPPLGQSVADGPFPTVVEYSGYQIAAPHDPIAQKIDQLFGVAMKDDPLLPDNATSVGSSLVRLAGYATVSVQLRGTGCSGGEADLFDRPSAADGYDAIETVAAQPWVLGSRVGMVGISFSGFSQLVTAATHPPHLAAIAPFSFAGRLWDVGWPGGVRNVGFAEGWLKERQDSTQAAPGPTALPYANALVGTDAYCAYNQRLRLQTRDAITLFREQFTKTDLYDRRDFVEAMSRIDVPVFGSLQYQDEQTGAAAMLGLDRLTPRNTRVWINLSDGQHVDSVSPDTVADLFEFLDIYVGGHSPDLKLPLYAIQSEIFGKNAAQIPAPKFFGLSLAEARQRWEAQPAFRYGFERRRGSTDDASGTRWSFRSSSFPPTGSTVQRWYLGPAGKLTRDVPNVGEASWISDPTKRPHTFGEWSTVPSGYGVGFVSEPLNRPLVTVGPVSADVWVASTASDTDLQVTITEVRPDGSEMLVNTGVQRASQRRLDPLIDSPLRPGFTFTDPEPLQAGLNLVRVQVLPIGHAFRTGSRIRIVIGPPGGDKESWRYGSGDVATKPINTVALGGDTPSFVTMAVVDAADIPATLAPCPLVAQPCRTYIPATNGG